MKMESGSTAGRTFITMWRDRGGNFGMMTALLAPLLFAVGGVSIDMANMLMSKNQLQDATDAAALAAASALVSKEQPSIEAAQEIARKFLRTQVAGAPSVAETESGADSEDDGVDVGISETQNGATGKTFKVTVTAKQIVNFNAMTRLLGQDRVTLETSSTAESATESKNALSMYLVLDRSGSMAWKTDTINTAKKSCPNYTESTWSKYPNLKATSPCYVAKIDALKTAASDLFAQLEVADPDSTYVRTGAVSYNASQDTPGDIAWGVTNTALYVNALEATGGTASGNAFKSAYQKVTASAENTAHASKNGQVPTKYIVFMTDGENNYTSEDTLTKQWCDTAKANKVEVYSVAFMAPSRGQALLKYCASSTSHYFEAEEAADLVAAFKAIGERASAMVSRLTK